MLSLGRRGTQGCDEPLSIPTVVVTGPFQYGNRLKMELTQEVKHQMISFQGLEYTKALRLLQLSLEY